MTRILFHLLMLILPFVLYWFYLRYAEKTGKEVKAYPLIPLLIIGCMLTLGTFFAFGEGRSAKPGDTYHPAIYKDGKIQPGTTD